MKLEDLFEVERGNHLDLNALTRAASGTNYVSCTAANNGVLARVARIGGIEPAPAGTISLALVGATCSAFLQPEPYYRAQNVVTLVPRRPMHDSEKLWWAYCIRQHAWRFNYGRKANRTFKTLELPDNVPSWVHRAVMPDYSHLAKKAGPGTALPDVTSWKAYRLSELFAITGGHSLELNKLDQEPGGVNFVSRTAKNNGVSAAVKLLPDMDPAPAGTLTVALGGSVLETFFQPEPYYCGYHVAVLKPLFVPTAARMLFASTLLRRERYRYNYGRQANRTLNKLELRLPVASDGNPDWMRVESFMASLPWSSSVSSPVAIAQAA